MGPATILNKLAHVRRRERLLRIIWGAARVVAVALALLALCCLADWLIDRWYDTPRWLLVFFLGMQVCVAAGLTVALIVLPALRPLSNSTVALWVERTFPEFRHRLITAVELNRAQATTEGMSPLLIATVTQEAEQKAAATPFGRAVDSRRLLWSAAVLLPVLLLVLLPALLVPQTVGELLGRQLLQPLEITRSVRFELQDVTTLPPENTLERDDARSPHYDLLEPAICASGDRVAIRFKAEGAVNENMHGLLRLRPTNGSTEDHDLVWESATPDGKAIFVASIPASSVDFTYKAWLGDARLRQKGHVTFEARPTVEAQAVTVLLPEYCGLRSDGTRFVQKTNADPKGEVLGMSGSTAQVTVLASKKLKRARLELLGPSQGGAPEQVLETKEMTFDGYTPLASCRFDLEPRQTAYRILVWDTLGFANYVIPRRGIALIPDEPPLVTLLPERFVPEDRRYTARPEDYETEGIPVVMGDSIRIAYRARSAAGLYGAQLYYRVNEAKDFTMLPLTEYKASPEVGPFELDRGIFAKIREDDRTAQVEFHAVDAPESERDRVPSRQDGGGRLHFQTGKIPGLKVGDKVEFYVEVLDNRPQHLAGRSEARIKDVVNTEQFIAWDLAKRQEVERLHDIEKRQREVFEPRRSPINREPGER